MRAAVMCSVLVLAWSGAAEAGKKKGKKSKAAPPPVEQAEAPPEVTPALETRIGEVSTVEGVGEFVALPCAWEPGLSALYDYSNVRVDQGTEALRIRDTITVTSVDSGPPSIVSYQATETNPDHITGDEAVVAGMLAAIEGVESLPIEVAISAEGDLVGIRNMEALAPSLDQMIANMKKDQPPEVAASIDAAFAQPAVRMSAFSKGPFTLLSLVCAEGQQQLEVSAITGYPNVWGGPPIAGTSTAVFEDIDPKAGTMTIRSLDRMDPESLQIASRGMLAQMLPPDADQAMMDAALAQLPPLESEIRSTYVMSLSDGLPISVTVTQETGRAGDSAHRIETTMWERQEQGAP